MTSYDFTAKERSGVDLITFGTADKTVTIDVTFIPSLLGFSIKEIMPTDPTEKITPETFAKIIALFTNEVDAQWIVDNADYGTLNQIALIIINKAFSRTPEKN